MASRIVVSLDRSDVSERALPLARALARQLDAPVTLVTVLDVPASLARFGSASAPPVDAARLDPMAQRAPYGRWSGWTSTEPSSRQLERVATETREAEKYLNRIAETFGDTHVEISVQFGRPDERILQVAEQRGDSIIVIASHGRSGISRALIGSVASRVARAATKPVFVVRCTNEYSGREDENVISSALFPVDGSEISEQTVTRAQQIFGPANLKVHLLSVIEHPDYEEHAMATEYLRALAERVSNAGSEVTWEVTEGFCADEVNRIAGEKGADIIVMATHGPAGFNQYILGSTAERVLNRADRPLLMIRPDDEGPGRN